VSHGFNGVSLDTMLQNIELYDECFDFGKDIQDVNLELFSAQCVHANEASFLKWAARFQPCLFGRIGARKANGVSYEFAVVDTSDIARGDLFVINKIQDIRRSWKTRARSGDSSALLILFKDYRLVRAKPGKQLIDLSQKIAGFYLLEHAPIAPDTIYTEAVPLDTNKGLGLFKAGINVFYSGAHMTLNHDRRVPGGMLISVNSPGHLANSLVGNGQFKSLDESVRWIYETAMHSVGNGGVSGFHKSATWHNTVVGDASRSSECPMRKLPAHIPENYCGSTYSAYYHTDVLVPAAVTEASILELPGFSPEVWDKLSLDYIAQLTAEAQGADGWFSPENINEEAIFHNPWPPLKAVNSPEFEY